jgi:hypothetical protein
MLPDFLDGLTDYLRQDPGVYALAANRIYPAELPAAEAKDMPRYAIVLIPAGGMSEASDVPLQSPRVDVFCYAATPKQARMLYYESARALRVLARDVHALTLLHSAVQSAGPLVGRTPETWPMCWASWIINASTEDAS